MKRRRRWWIWLVVPGIVLLAAWMIPGAATTWIIHGIVDSPTGDTIFTEDGDPDRQWLEDRGIDTQLRLAVGRPQVSLLVWVLHPSPPATTPPTVVVLHGIRDRMNSMLGVGQWLSRQGYQVVLMDMRGHGRSSGRYLTYGVREGEDLVQALRELRDRGIVRGRVAIFGPSYGGAVAIQAAAGDAAVSTVITVCTFTRLRDVVPGYVNHYLPLVGRLIPSTTVDNAVTRAGELAGFDADDADSVAAMAGLRVPVLLVHGGNDRKIPLSHARRLLAAAPDGSELLIIDGANHDNILADESGQLRTKVQGWLHQHLDEE
jgi:alpha-beta hydrolase superfamily lysophospholipase